MGFQTNIVRGRPTTRYINRLAANVRVSHRPGSDMMVTQTGNHQQYNAIVPPRPAGGAATAIHARLSAFASGTYTAVEQEPDGSGGWQDLSGGRTFTEVRAVGGFQPGIELGAIVPLTRVGEVGGTAAYTFVFVQPRAAFRVALTQVGGSQGNATTQASWTYDVDDMDGNAIATAQAPTDKGRRADAGPVTVATAGLGCYQASGTFELLEAYEVAQTVECT